MYCSKCGKEMSDDAIICTGCGCLLNRQRVKVVSQNDRHTLFEENRVRQKQDTKSHESIELEKNNDSKTAFLCLIITIICFSLTILSFLFALASLELYFVNSNRMILWLDPSKLTCSFVFSAVTLVASIISLVFALKKNTGKEMKLLAISSLTLAVAFVLGILKLCTVFAW